MDTTRATKLAEYKNGNTDVTIFSDGTKIREYEGEPFVVHPESIDVKITNYCDLGCAWCHESSTKKGAHGNLNKLLEILRGLPAGVELAIGGGNPLSHPDLDSFLLELKSRGLIANLTVNQGHLRRYREALFGFIKEDLVRGVGISMTRIDDLENAKPLMETTGNIVFHLIAGVNRVGLLNALLAVKDVKILLLGYKQFGFGKDFFGAQVTENLREWKKALPVFLEQCSISFDNLALEQLQVRRLLTNEAWENFYMGDDFHFTMYIDAVKEEYAPTSRSNFRKSFQECSLIEFFKRNSSR